KAKEWIVATKLEMVFSKEDILTMYFNTVDFGNNAFGIKTACDTYFGTTPDNLTYEQAATLIGLLKATSTYNPKRNPENSKARRNIVLGLVFENDQLILNGHSATTMQLDSLQNLPMITSERASLHNNLGQAPYFRKAVEEYINQLCEQGYINGYDGERKLDLYNAGLKIYTTLDMTMQQYAETAAWKQMRSLQQKFDDHWGNQEPWCDAQGKEIPGFIDNIAKRTTMYSYLEKKYKGQQDSIYYYLNQPHPVEVFTYNGPEKRNMSVMDSIRYMVHFLHCGFIAIEPDTREVKAWVGDIDYDSWEYNKVTARRQPGSTFKLFVYTEAMNQGLTPCDRRMDSYVAYPDTMHGKITKWAPHNANGYFTNANMPLKTAFARSVNSVAVKLGVEMGIKNVARTAHAMGIESKLDETKSLSLGASDVTLIELVNAYCTIAADGIYNMPILVKRIEDKYGNVLYQSKLTNKQAIPYRSAFLMQKMLQNTLTGGGTVAALWQYIHPVLETGTTFGGKTGTTNNHSDAWFVGVTPGLVAGAWVGGEYRSIHFRSGALGQGSRTALPIFGNFIQSVLKDNRFKKYYREFPDIPKEHVENASWSCEGYYQSQAVEDTITYTDIDEENRGPAPTFVVETYTEVETSANTDATSESSPTSTETTE
ncbi:MAG: transglycosylase domain-containing protein, partial [Bacteroidaceae bacterium]|nr:transglycosylase domain-containing protein [Bacteroidaceae bacterium]